MLLNRLKSVLAFSFRVTRETFQLVEVLIAQKVTGSGSRELEEKHRQKGIGLFVSCKSGHVYS